MEQKHRPLGRPRQDKKAKPTKDVIIDVATMLFLTRGYQLVSIDDVAKECGVTKATIYYYYATKADLFTATMVQMMIRIQQRMAHILSAKTPLKERLLELAKAQLKATVDIDLKGFMKEAKISLSEEQLQQMKEVEDKLYAVLEEALTKAMADGEIPSSHPQLAAHAFLSILAVGNYKDTNQQPIIQDLDALAIQLVNLYWNGLNE
ncbi:TetR/AcrR family transcriptional regulator [Priestia taiwanensis]|uniref:TetR family transcriptional regulator n=1 Tax=Priestia taiwanensis TaxID=1347902 RepID=A0A917ASJ4_9BACI|nr:TetR/AcrR family transcriptional regulator [Priestia taiwanensis]MBM7364005.1 AcrR family transcriptional regulator [Priestia taiwanensis]GGE70889.1 TetR family transcriptional regulator [Priestia taiwanensis]